MKLLGAAWCGQFQPSKSVDDLTPEFSAKVSAFIAALQEADARVTIADTYRPPERAYLMHYACLVAGYTDDAKVFHQIAPSAVPAMDGVDINWTCGGDLANARAAAAAMVKGYDIKFPAALESRHTERRAVDMTITFQGSITVETKNGNLVRVAALSDLYPVGATYGVMKLVSDKPHWSDDGH